MSDNGIISLAISVITLSSRCFITSSDNVSKFRSVEDADPEANPDIFLLNAFNKLLDLFIFFLVPLAVRIVSWDFEIN